MINKLKAKIHATLFWQTGLGEILNKGYDLKIFYKYSFLRNNLKSKENYEAFLTKQYHIVEKGLSLPVPRKNFGIEKIKTLIKITEEFKKKYSVRESRLLKTISATLRYYLDKNVTLKEDHPDAYKIISEFCSVNPYNNNGGLKLINTKAFYPNDFENFVKTRSSVRNFSRENVSLNDIKLAIEIAKTAPSVCNRQSWRVHLYQEKSEICELLSYQDGNNGFTNNINKLLIITTDTNCFTHLETNQIYIDGGLFAMNLLLGLHSQKIASCCLNLCVPYTKEKNIKKIASIDNSERLIMMIGIGYYLENTMVAMSDRKEINQILSIH